MIRIGLSLLFFLPIIESINRDFGFQVLLLGSVFIASRVFFWRKIDLDKIDILFLAMLFVFAVSTIFSWSFERSFTELTRYIAYFLIFFTIRHSKNKQALLKKYFVPTVIINSLILSVLALIYMIPGLHLLPPSSGMNLFYPVFGHNRLADILVFAIPLTLYLEVQPSEWLNHIRNLLTFFFILMLIFSMGRAAMLSLIISFSIIFYLKDRSFERLLLFKARWLVLLGSAVLLVLSSSFICSNFVNKNVRICRQIKGFYNPVEDDFRLEYFKQAVTGFFQSPILGTGLDTFRMLSERQKGNHPFSFSWFVHNHYLQIFTETGFFGGVLFMIVILYCLVLATRQIRSDQYGIYVGFLSSSIQSLIDFNWQFYSIFLFMLMGAALVIKKH